MPHVSTDEGERSVSENHTDPAAAEQTSEASLTPKSAGRRKRRIETRYGLTPGHLINEADIWLLIILDHCCNTENISFLNKTQMCFFQRGYIISLKKQQSASKKVLKNHLFVFVSDIRQQCYNNCLWSNRRAERGKQQEMREDSDSEHTEDQGLEPHQQSQNQGALLKLLLSWTPLCVLVCSHADLFFVC